MGSNLKILYNSILILDQYNVFTYLYWLGISGFISQNPPKFNREWKKIQFVNAQGSST